MEDEHSRKKANSDCTKAIEKKPKHLRAYYRQLHDYKKRQHDEAISHWTKVIELNPKGYLAYIHRAIAYVMKGQYDNAISDCNKAIDIKPEDAQAYYCRGRLYEDIGQYDKAISDFNKAIELAPKLFMAYNRKAWILATCRDAKYRDGAKALELAKKAVEISPEAWTLDTLAAAYAEVGKFEDAIITQEKAIDFLKKEERPNNAIDQYIDRLKSYKTHKPWREK